MLRKIEWVFLFGDAASLAMPGVVEDFFRGGADLGCQMTNQISEVVI